MSRLVHRPQGANDVEHIIDCNDPPYIPPGWGIAVHRHGGQWKWHPSQIALWTVESKAAADENQLRAALSDHRILNATVLDHLLLFPDLIPEAWKDKSTRKATCVFFGGTIYCTETGGLYLRCLFWHEGQWDWGCESLKIACTFPLVVRTSSAER